MFEGDQSVIGWGLEAIAAYIYTHIMNAATYSVCMYFVYISAYHIHTGLQEFTPMNTIYVTIGQFYQKL